MIRKLLLVTTLVAIPILAPSQAQAKEEYCREYTKTVRVGERTEQAYGTACYRPDGSWEIINLEGSNYGRDQVRDVMYQDLKHDYRHNPYKEVVVVERHNRPHYRYSRSNYSSSPIVFNFGFGAKNDHRFKNHYKKKVIKHKHHHHGHR